MDYFARFLMSTRPPGDDIYELLVTGVDSIGVLNKITAILAKGNVNFVSSHGQMDEAGKLFTNAFFCEMAKAKVTPDELKKELEALPFVKDVRLESMKGRMHEANMFPLSTFFAGRVLVLGAAAFSQIEARLVEIFGSAGEVMAYEQGRAYSLATLADMEGYRKKVGATWDVGNIADWVRAQGWAAAEITETAEGYHVKLSSVPTHKGDEESGGVSRFLTGMMVGMLETPAGQRLAAGPTVYDQATKSYSFKVIRQPGSSRPK